LIAALLFELWRFVGRGFALWRLLTPSTLDATPKQDRPLREVVGHGREAWRSASGLRGCCEQHFVPDAAQAPQPEPVEPENPFHVRKSHRIAARPRSKTESLVTPYALIAGAISRSLATISFSVMSATSLMAEC
jgi:hypothetical protein